MVYLIAYRSINQVEVAVRCKKPRRSTSGNGRGERLDFTNEELGGGTEAVANSIFFGGGWG